MAAGTSVCVLYMERSWDFARVVCVYLFVNPVLFVNPAEMALALPCAVHLSTLDLFFGALTVIFIHILLALVRMQSE